MLTTKVNPSVVETGTFQENWALQWRHNGRDDVSNHRLHDYLLNRLFRHRSKKTSKLRVAGFCAGNSPVTGEFPAQRASNAENVSIWWRHHVKTMADDALAPYAVKSAASTLEYVGQTGHCLPRFGHHVRNFSKLTRNCWKRVESYVHEPFQNLCQLNFIRKWVSIVGVLCKDF